MKKKHTFVDVIGNLIVETKKQRTDEGAYLINDGKTEAWVPKACCEKFPHSSGKAGMYVFTMPEDVALDKGFI